MDIVLIGLDQLPKQVQAHQVSRRLSCADGRGWDDLFKKCGEHLNSLTAMKLSPYYRGEQYLVLSLTVSL